MLLTEWTRHEHLPLSREQRDILLTRFGASVQPSPGLDGHYDVTPTERVGAAVLGETVVVVQPKIPIERLFFLLEYTADPVGWQDEAVTLGAAPDFVTGMAAVFARLAARALDQGLLTGYHAEEDDAYTVRGRIDLATQLRRRPGLDAPIAVAYQEYDENVIENQLLLAATRLLRPLPIRDPHAQASLRRIADSLQQVDPIAFTRATVPAVRWTRLNRHYRSAVEFARLLLQHNSIDLRHGPHTTLAVTLDMNRVFEQFVRGALREALGAQETAFPAGAAGHRLYLDRQELVNLEPDVTWWDGGRCWFVGDVKYKRDHGRGHNDDVYQLLAYATALGLPSAMLIYAHGPQDSTRHHVRNTGIALHRHRLDLSAPPATLLAQIATLAAHIRQTTADTPSTS